MGLINIVAGARKLAANGNLRALLVSAGVAAGIVQLQTLAAAANETLEVAELQQRLHTDHIALLQGQISDLEAQALNSVRAAIASGMYDDAVRLRADDLQRQADIDEVPYPPGPRGAESARALFATDGERPVPWIYPACLHRPDTHWTNTTPCLECPTGAPANTTGWPRHESDPAPPTAASWAAAQQGKSVAKCGQPFPCEHAPDGGNHPVVKA